MNTFQEKLFWDSIEKFKREKFSEAQENEIKDNKWRNEFITKYPRDSIISMTMNDYLMSRKNGYGNPNSFCRKICFKLESTYPIRVISWNTFGISLKNGSQLALSKTFSVEFGSDYDEAFISIKNEIIKLLDAIDKNNYTAVECCKLHSNFKYMLLFIYFPEKFVPVAIKKLLYQYCGKVGMTFNPEEEMIYSNIELINWKNAVPEIAEWSNTIFTSFCNWLYRSNRSIDGKSLMRDINISTISEEIDKLNLQGKSKEAVVRVRVNQGVFRNKLLQRYSKCCLCGVSNPNLLIASHIKSWSESEPNEKLDIDNGLLMCPNHDRLFDQGWLTFDENGYVIIADGLSEGDRIALNINDNMKITLTEKNKKYLLYHRKKFEDINCIEKEKKT